jgi:hypothetical protein
MKRGPSHHHQINHWHLKLPFLFVQGLICPLSCSGSGRVRHALGTAVWRRQLAILDRMSGYPSRYPGIDNLFIGCLFSSFVRCTLCPSTCSVILSAFRPFFIFTTVKTIYWLACPTTIGFRFPSAWLMTLPCHCQTCANHIQDLLD